MLVPDQFRAVDAPHLFPGAPLVVKDAAFPHKELCQLLQGLLREAVLLPVHLVVAQAHGEGVDLLRRQFPPALFVDEGQILPAHAAAPVYPGLFDYIHARSPSSV